MEFSWHSENVTNIYNRTLPFCHTTFKYSNICINNVGHKLNMVDQTDLITDLVCYSALLVSITKDLEH